MLGQELIDLKISDINSERKTIHIRQSKYKNDRILSLPDLLAKDLRKFINAENPHIWLFKGKQSDGR
jgi:integrase/recombinase XerD